jgi:hypothetical protein
VTTARQKTVATRRRPSTLAAEVIAGTIPVAEQEQASRQVRGGATAGRRDQDAPPARTLHVTHLTPLTWSTGGVIRIGEAAARTISLMSMPS